MKTNAAHMLDALGIRYELREYEVDEADLSAESVARKIGMPAEQVFKTLVCRGDRGGVLFAAFPLVYASLFSGFYVAFMLVLLVLILRTVAIEVRSKEESPRWRTTWDAIFALSSIGLAALLGVAFGNVLSGVPIDAEGNITIGLLDMLRPFALLVGVATASMFAMHGALYLVMKTQGELQARIRRVTPALMVGFFVLNTSDTKTP
jgi:cytochrome d ubiquinol oxidase subunit II